MFARLFEEGYTQIHINKNNVKSSKKTVKNGDFGENDPI